MPDDPSKPLNIPVDVANPKEKELSWCDFPNPLAFVRFLHGLFSVNLSLVKDFTQVLFSSSKPSVENLDKIWFYNGSPAFISWRISGKFQNIYQYPVNIAMYWNDKSIALPDGMSKLTDAELTDIGLMNGDNGFWVVFKPSQVS